MSRDLCKMCGVGQLSAKIFQFICIVWCLIMADIANNAYAMWETLKHGNISKIIQDFEGNLRVWSIHWYKSSLKILHWYVNDVHICDTSSKNS